MRWVFRAARFTAKSSVTTLKVSPNWATVWTRQATQGSSAGTHEHERPKTFGRMNVSSPPRRPRSLCLCAFQSSNQPHMTTGTSALRGGHNVEYLSSLISSALTRKSRARVLASRKAPRSRRSSDPPEMPRRPRPSHKIHRTDGSGTFIENLLRV